jgi:hypothetical protein
MRPSASSGRIIGSPIFARARQPLLLRFAADPQAPRALLGEHPLPALQLVRAHLALARDRVQGLAPQERRHQFRLPRGAPALRQLGKLSRGWFTTRRRRLQPLVAHAPASLVAVIVVQTVSKEIRSGLPSPTWTAATMDRILMRMGFILSMLSGLASTTKVC